MLNTIWPVFIIISITFAITTGNVPKINDAIFSSAKNTIELCITLLGTICLWNRYYADCFTNKNIKCFKKIDKSYYEKAFSRYKKGRQGL